MNNDKKYAALYCREDSAYKKRNSWDVWDKERDARLYNGTLPVVCHPPCRAWGLLQHESFRGTDNPSYNRSIEMKLCFDALSTIYSVGGILEHPAGSRFWNTGNFYNGQLITIDQFDFGHVANKATKLFIWPAVRIPEYPWPSHQKSKQISRGYNGQSRCTQYEREYTPDLLIDWFEKILDEIIQHRVIHTKS